MVPTLLSPERHWVPAERVRAARPGVLLGEGSSAQVFECELDGRLLALKLSRPGAEAALLREAEVLAGACSAGLPRLWGADLTSDRAALLLDRIEGEALRSAWSSLEGDAVVDLAAAVLSGVGSALSDLHGMGVVHGDVKPDNVVVRPDGTAVLIDLGLSTHADQHLTGGTPRYLGFPVEASLRGPERDVVALALSLAELLLPTLREKPDLRAGLEQPLPMPFERLLRPFFRVGSSPRPPLSWLLEEAREVFGLRRSDQRQKSELWRAYLQVRSDEVNFAVSRGLTEDGIQVRGAPREWLRPLVGVKRQVELRRRSDHPGRKSSSDRTPRGLGEMSSHDRARLLTRLVGPAAANWPVPEQDDEALLARLAELLVGRRPSAWLSSDLSSRSEAEDLGGVDEAGLGVRLGRRPIAPAVVSLVERGSYSASLKLEAARALRQQGELYRSARLLEELLTGSQRSEALVELSLVRRRLGDPEATSALAPLLDQPEANVAMAVRAAALALVARHALEQQGSREALARLEQAPASAPICEIRALALLYAGDGDAAREALLRGRSMARDDEELARIEGVLGMVEHHGGRAEAAASAFRRAVESSARAGAALEEATYLTGLAAACTDLGQWEEALGAAERAELLFEALGRPGLGARAILSRASILSVSGEVQELGSLVRRGLRRAEEAGDDRCAGYLHLCLCDGSDEDAVRREAADRAAHLLSSADDRLRARARLVALGEHFEAEHDAQAKNASSFDARVEWWGARADRLLAATTRGQEPTYPERAAHVLEQIIPLANTNSRAIALGPTLAAGAQLALSLGRGEDARMLFSRAHGLAVRFTAGLPERLTARIKGLPWVVSAQGAVGQNFEPAQLADVESLLRALGRRRGLSDLLSKVLDLLLLWTGVERGMILLRAPGGRLVVRAARNLARADLKGQQLELSRSIAERAQGEGQEVVMVDAVQDATGSQRSVLALNLRSVLAAPLTAHGEILGVVYLDDRVRRGAFGMRERAWIRLIGTVAGLAIAEERDRLRLRRAARRAQRAEQRLATQLRETEGELELAERELSSATQQLRGNYAGIVGRGKQMKQVLGLVDRIAKSDVPVLISGESGSGKELIARAIAKNGPRKGKPFVVENCSAVPETLLESTLFGHTKGAFTGASRERAGLFQLADGGTLFLDEIGEMSLAMQSKLLRVLQDGIVRPLGSERESRVDVRLLVATHRDLKARVERGTFRQDLYYRLNVVEVRLPPLRERREDILPLIEHFLEKHGEGEARSLSKAALARLVDFPWPGNVRQLENEVRRALVLGSYEISAADLSPEILEGSIASPQPVTLREKVDALERRLVTEALEEAAGNRTRAAQALGLSRYGLQKMIQRLSIENVKTAPHSP